MGIIQLNRSFSKSPGFTIVELLIVVVVIAILASITIVSYNGIQSRARTASAQSTAANAAKKAEIYANETGNYPTTSTVLTEAAAVNTTYYLKGATISSAAVTSSSSATTVNYYRCGTATSAAATSLATITITTGAQFRYRNYSTNTTSIVNVGQASGTSVGGYTITCYITT
ncbi:prepilin-type N-terminal cleavage/methylation domain-containing protein [Candidatus Saccharibacteria bacterium]|nr:prepilin-type N-terminal cleavage/methylation domain-containing protein [Candidatus Saccharibacteria bacterium]